VMFFPCRLKLERLPPTGGIASVTSIGRPRPRSARRSMAGSTGAPSTVRPYQELGGSNARAIGPPSPLDKGRLAFKRCREPASPVRQGGGGRREGCQGGPQRYATARRNELGDESLRHEFGRQGHEQHAVARRR